MCSAVCASSPQGHWSEIECVAFSLYNTATCLSSSLQYPHLWDTVQLFRRIDQGLAASLGGTVAQSVERTTPGEEVLCSIPAAAARSILVQLLGRCPYNVTG